MNGKYFLRRMLPLEIVQLIIHSLCTFVVPSIHRKLLALSYRQATQSQTKDLVVGSISIHMASNCTRTILSIVLQTCQCFSQCLLLKVSSCSRS